MGFSTIKYGRALGSFALITLVYFFIFIWADAKASLIDQVSRFYLILPTLFFISFISYVIRFIRWSWLLKRAGFSMGLWRGFLIYISGFAFTATPGKVGELVRIRYLSPIGIPPAAAVGVFVFERSVDLVSVLMLSAIAITNIKIFLFILIFVASFLSVIYFFAYRADLPIKASNWFFNKAFFRLAKIILTFGNGLSYSRGWINLRDLSAAFFFGLLAWGITSYNFMLMLGYLDIHISPLVSFSIYPLAMLGGAASMIPGGLGSTEALIIVLLMSHGVLLGLASVAAIGIRLVTIWFSILIGFIGLVTLEVLGKKESTIK